MKKFAGLKEVAARLAAKEIEFISTREYPVGSKADREVTEFRARKVRSNIAIPKADGLEVTLEVTRSYFGTDGKADRYNTTYSNFTLSREQVAQLRTLLNAEVI